MALLQHLEEKLSPQPFLVLNLRLLNPTAKFTDPLQGVLGLETTTLPLAAALPSLLDDWITKVASEGSAPPVIVIGGLHGGRLQVLMLGNLPEEDAKTFVYGGLHGGRLQVLMLGNLPEEDAKTFVYDNLLQEFSDNLDFGLPDGVWPELHAVCGGNFSNLQRTVAQAAAAFASGFGLEAAWARALSKRRGEAVAIVQRGFAPNIIPARGGQTPAWTPQQWFAALEELGSHPGHAVPMERMQAVLGGEDPLGGAAALESLVRFHFLALRELSPLAYDLPDEVYGDDSVGTTVVVAPNAAVLQYIRGGRWKDTA
ncbi:hypothetical protein GPECTOR_13g859 [Gonium pectorale]|uniref:Uncharacterized protein n=1 Tax=Gonium pectorale TaxID=33097 RepID=A0A150GPV3_GONPE|nr:hypothetical protein GPECTOR_13g859 [Gonium pectorale]|eukprot:KXZ51370.1 hypothetical protein GPECTOR_13g859 [Gonium pectorale]